MNRTSNILKDNYKLRSVIGTGGFSTVYHAKDASGRDFAVKEFTADHMDGLATTLRANAYGIACQSEPQPVEDPSNIPSQEKLSRGLMQILREAQIMEMFRDIPGIPGVVETFEENDTIYLVKEYLEGMTCLDYMKRFGGKLPIILALYIMRGTLKILSPLHKRGYIHCDVSPINTFLCRDGTVYLIDWGNAVDLSGSMEDHIVRQAINVRYAAPEQQISGHLLTRATDIYSLCASVYEAVCGQPPCRAIDRLQGGTLVPPNVIQTDIPSFLNNLLLRGLELHPEDRPQSVDELIEIIDREITFKITPVEGTDNVSLSGTFLHEESRPFSFLTSRRLRRPTIL